MKVANLRSLQQQRPDRSYVGTWNSPGNEPMMAINRALGTRPRERMLAVQRSLAASDRLAVDAAPTAPC